MSISMHSRRTAVAVLLAAAALTGCGSASAPSPPAGVDGLEIPTPTPDPADFVAKIDNPWLPLERYARWEYDDEDDSGRYQTVVTVEAGPRIDGVATTAVHRQPSGARGRTGSSIDYYAQDRSGNVWWFGREGEWEAGTADAQAGLAMPAKPRRGDGFAMARPTGEAPVASVIALDEEQQVRLGKFDDVLLLEVSIGEVVREEYYAKGVGLIASETIGLGLKSGLAAYDEPR